MFKLKDMERTERTKFIESVVFTFVCIYFNFNSALTYSISAQNFIISIGFVIFWFVFMLAGKRSRFLMFWGVGLWGVTAVTTMFSNYTLTAGGVPIAANLLTAVISAPLFGLRCFFGSATANIVIPMAFSIALAALGLRFLRMQSSKKKPALPVGIIEDTDTLFIKSETDEK